MTPNSVIQAADLAACLGDTDLLVVDCRKDLGDAQAGRAAYAKAHVPGAVYADLDVDLSDLGKQGLGRHPLPDAEAFSHVLSRWGWTPATRVVAVDASAGALAAARLWWMLRLAGARDVAVLDGGFAAWCANGFATEAGEVTRAPGSVEVRFDERQIVGYAELEQGLARGSLLLVDARAAPRFRGEIEPLDARAGHVPGAVNRPFAENLGADGCFKPVALLRAEFSALIGARPSREVVHMCGSGVTACHNLLAMEHAGLTGSRVFAPSWSGWISDPARAVATPTS